MIERKMVIVGNERLEIPVSNTYDSGVSIRIQFDGKEKCRILLMFDSECRDVTEDCKLIQIMDHECYRRLKREYAFTIGKDVYWSILRRYSDSKDRELKLIRVAADMLDIELEYDTVKETGQK